MSASVKASTKDTAAHILVLEALTLATCPAEYETRIDGWVLRSSPSKVMRANTITIFAEAVLTDSAFNAQLETCVQWYAQWDKKIHFRISAHPAAMAVDRALAAHGYAMYGATQVMEITDLSSTILNAPASAWQTQAIDVGTATQWRMISRGESVAIAMREAQAARQYGQEQADAQNGDAAAVQAWLDRIIAAAAAPDRAATILNLPRQTYACAIYDAQQNKIAAGVARTCGSYVGLFNIYTAPEYRGQGCGKAITQGLLAWARTVGATAAFLQVEAENQTAINLYARLGFIPIYQYHYRRQRE